MAVAGVLLPLIPAEPAPAGREISALVEERYGPRLATFSIQPMDRDALAADVGDGRAALLLEGRLYDVLLEERRVVRDGAVPMLIGDDGVARPDPSHEFPSRFFAGRIADEPESRVLLVLAQAGAFGYVRGEDGWTHFQPLGHVLRGADRLHVVFPHEAMTLTGVADVERSVPAEPTPAAGPRSPMAVLSAISPGAALMGDKEFYDTYVSCWWCKMDYVMATVDDIYDLSFAWTITVNARVTCTTATCDTDAGVSSTNSAMLLSQFATKEASDRSSGETWDMAHFFGGNAFSDAIGRAYIAGRYGVNQMVDAAGTTYDGGSIDYEGGLLAAHEMGHNFYGEHGDAVSYDHCHAYWGWCWDNFRHHTVMSTPHDHEPSTDNEMVGDFSTQNINDMNACNDGTWAALSFTPGDYACS